jgi:hypothetical protein
MTRDQSTLSRVGLVFLVAGLVLASAGAALGATPVVDTETTNTSTTSDITGSTVISNYTADPAKNSSLEFEIDSQNPEVWLVDDRTGEVVRIYSDADFTQTGTDSDQTPTYYHFRRNFSHDEFSTISGFTGENSTVSMRIYNNSNATNPDTLWVNFTITQQDRTVVRAGSAAAERGDLSLGVDGFTFESVGVSVFDDNFATFEDTVAVPGSNGTITVVSANGTTEDRLAASADGVSSGEWIQSTVVQLGDEPVRVFLDSAPDGWDKSNSYAVYDSGTQDITIYVGDDVDTSSADLTVEGNVGFLKQDDVYDTLDLVTKGMIPMPAMLGGSMSFVGVGMLVAGRQWGCRPMTGLTLHVPTELLIATLAVFFGAIGDWGIIRALHRIWIFIYTSAASYVATLVITVFVLVFAVLDLILTAVPYVFDDGMPFGEGLVSAYGDIARWAASNLEYAFGGMTRDGSYYRAGIVM